MHRAVLICCTVLLASPCFAQSHAAAGAIEGTVFTDAGSVLPGVTVVITNTVTEMERAAVTNEHGLYRVLLLSPGTYRIAAQVPGFRRFEQTDTVLHPGQIVVADARLSAGETNDDVIRRSGDTVSPVRAGNIHAARIISRRDIDALPMTSRNALNLALLSSNVSGLEDVYFNTPALSANGAPLHASFLVDGSTNPRLHQPGASQPLSEVTVGEMTVVTAGYAPEFGQTTGVLVSAVTPSGSDRMHGSAGYVFSRTAFSADPFFVARPVSEAARPDAGLDAVTGTLSGPIIRDRAQFYAGLERTSRALAWSRVVAITADEAAALGLPPQPAAVPAGQTATSFIGKAESQVMRAHHITASHLRFRNDAPFSGTASGRDSLQRATDLRSDMTSTAVQVATTLGNRQLNEFRFQYSDGNQGSVRNSASGDGPAIDVAGIRFGSPLHGFGLSNAGAEATQRVVQFADNYSLLRASHHYKFGGGMQWVRLARVSAPVRAYTFPDPAAYRAASTGADPFAYSQFTQLLGDLDVETDARLYSVFVQDDWQLTPSLKVLYGIRYDKHRQASAAPDAPFAFSREFANDTNNWAPRAGVAWAPNDRTVLRASTGLLYDEPMLGAYLSALQLNGASRTTFINVAPGAAGAPAFPDTFNGSGAAALPAPSIVTVDPEFQLPRTWQSHIQIERSLGGDYMVSAGYLHARHSNLATTSDINLINAVGRLEDGRPVFGGEVGEATRMDPRFNHIYNLESAGEGTYHAISFAVARRYARALGMDLSYTLAKAEDNAPIGPFEWRSDPTNQDRDRGPALLDVRHNFTGSFVYNPAFVLGSRVANALVNGNQIGVILHMRSGFPFTVRSAADLNGDGVANDRPVSLGRNAFRLPARYNVDLRLTRRVALRTLTGEVIGELRNVFNSRQTAAVNSVVSLGSGGHLATPLPSEFPPVDGFAPRQLQIGIRLRF